MIISNFDSGSIQVTLRSNQILRFAGVKIVVPSTSVLAYPDAVLYNVRGENITKVKCCHRRSSLQMTNIVSG